MKNRCLLAISSLLLAATVSAGAVRKAAANTEVDPGTAFSRLKALVGDWDAESSQGKAHSRFELIAGGSELLEHFSNLAPSIVAMEACSSSQHWARRFMECRWSNRLCAWCHRNAAKGFCRRWNAYAGDATG